LEITGESYVNAFRTVPITVETPNDAGTPKLYPVAILHLAAVADVHAVVRQVVNPPVAVKLASAAPKFRPDMVSIVPPLDGPFDRNKLVTAGASYVKVVPIDPTRSATVSASDWAREAPDELTEDLQIKSELEIHEVVAQRVAPTRGSGVASSNPKLKPKSERLALPVVGKLCVPTAVLTVGAS
jgi:hypothetical protein